MTLLFELGRNYSINQLSNKLHYVRHSINRLNAATINIHIDTKPFVLNGHVYNNGISINLMSGDDLDNDYNIVSIYPSHSAELAKSDLLELCMRSGKATILSTSNTPYSKYVIRAATVKVL